MPRWAALGREYDTSLDPRYWVDRPLENRAGVRHHIRATHRRGNASFVVFYRFDEL